MFNIEKFSLIGNRLFLDFVNTQKMRDRQPFETLEKLKDFAAWAIAVRLIDEKQAPDFLEQWQQIVGNTDFMDDIRKFRNMVREMVEDVAAGKKVKSATIKIINSQLKKHSGFMEIAENGDGFEKRFQIDFSKPANLLQPVAESVADFLCYENFEYLRKCGSANCVLYFYDTTKNHKRRWCSMAGCGNLAKAAAFYQRKKQVK